MKSSKRPRLPYLGSIPLLSFALCSLLCATVIADTKPNVLLICVDDLRPELRSFGVEYIQSPNIDRLAASGRAFHNHYVNAPTCGASRYSLLTGRYGPSGNNALFQRAEKLAEDDASVTPSMPEWFRQNGYKTVSVGKVSHHPGGWGGEDWYDHNIIEMPGAWDRQLMPTGAWKHPRGAMHSLVHGEIKKIGSFSENKMEVMQSAESEDTDYHDGLIAEAGIEQLENLAEFHTPFFLAIGFIKPHLPFGAPARYMDPYKDVELPPIPHPEKPEGQTTWHGSGEFFNQYYHHGKDPREDAEYADEVRRHYAACVSYVDHLVGRILSKLKETGKDKDTIVVLWGDHGWHLGEHAIWGKHCLFEEALRSPLIISAPGMVEPGTKSNAIVETADIFPTLSELAGLPAPTFVKGTSLSPQMDDPDAPGHTAYAYNARARTIRTEDHRIILHRDGYVELYDHRSAEKETHNIAKANAAFANKLKALIEEKSNDLAR